MPTRAARYALALLVGLLAPAVELVGPTWAFQDSGSYFQEPSSKPSGNDRGYVWVMAGEGFLEDAHTSLNSYKAPGGERIDTVKAHFRSAEAAKSAHQNLDHSAAQIVKREDILDESGKVIGERSVLILVKKEHTKTAIVITKGSDFREYISDSSQDALAFEDYAKSLEAEHARSKQ